MSSLPQPRGALSSAVIGSLERDEPALLPSAPAAPADPLTDDDLHLALWVGYELHYRGFDGVPDAWEWQPELISLRRRLEGFVLDALRAAVVVTPDGRPVAEQLTELVEGDDGPSVSRYLQTKATRTQLHEYLAHRSVYQLKEADPHAWAVPRLSGRAKAALVEIQTDEYGGGQLRRMHSQLFRDLLDELGLDSTDNGYVDQVPGSTLAVSNVMTMFGLNRHLRGALAGHLAAYEMTSSEPCRRYAKALRRFGASDRACAFHDAHVTADALHEQLAAHDLCGSLVAEEPDLLPDVLFGAAACLLVENRFAEHLLASWGKGLSSLRPVLPAYDCHRTTA